MYIVRETQLCHKSLDLKNWNVSYSIATQVLAQISPWKNLFYARVENKRLKNWRSISH